MPTTHPVQLPLPFDGPPRFWINRARLHLGGWDQTRSAPSLLVTEIRSPLLCRVVRTHVRLVREGRAR